jgi:hypothetical protein
VCLKIACQPSFRISRISARLRLGSWADPGGQIAGKGWRLPRRKLRPSRRTGSTPVSRSIRNYPAPGTSMSAPRRPEIRFEEVTGMLADLAGSISQTPYLRVRRRPSDWVIRILSAV